MGMIYSSLTGHIDAEARPPGVEKWLLLLIFRTIGPAPVRLVLGNGKGLSPSRCRASIHDLDSRSADPSGSPFDTEIAFGDAFTDGRIRVTGDLTALLEAVYASMGDTKKAPGWCSRSIIKMDRVMATEHAGRLTAQHPLPPSSGEPPTRLYLRVLYFRRGNPRTSADCQAGLCVPEAAVAAGRDCCRSRLRVGRAGPPYGPQLRCPRKGVQHRLGGTNPAAILPCP
jgi:hypothetical protein